MQPLNVAVIGGGYMGERHARIYAGMPDVQLVAVCDVREDAARELGRGRAPRSTQTFSWILPRGFPATGDHRLDVVGSAGALSIATLETGLRRADGQRSVQVDTASSPSVQGHPGGMFYFELRRLVDCVRRRVTPAVTPRRRDGLRIAVAIGRAAATGSPAVP